MSEFEITVFIITTKILLGLFKKEPNRGLNIYVIILYNILRAYSHFGLQFHSEREMIPIKILFLLTIIYVLSLTSNYYLRIWLLLQMIGVSLYIILQAIIEIIGPEGVQAIHDYRKKLERDYNRTQ